jgi:hypothetical protein
MGSVCEDVMEVQEVELFKVKVKRGTVKIRGAALTARWHLVRKRLQQRLQCMH